MRIKQKEFEQAVELRKQGYSLREISEQLHISKGTASLWCKDIILSEKAKGRLVKLYKEGTTRGQQKNRIKWDLYKENIRIKAEIKYKNIKLNKYSYELLCSLLYVCEGTTSVSSGVRFMNSDPKLIQLFLHLFRQSFNIDNKKFRACVHLHNYHNKERHLKYWSKITRIPLSQFVKPYQKMNTKKRTREGYKGCISIRYYDNKVGRELQFLYFILLEDLKIT